MRGLGSHRPDPRWGTGLNVPDLFFGGSAAYCSPRRLANCGAKRVQRPVMHSMNFPRIRHPINERVLIVWSPVGSLDPKVLRRRPSEPFLGRWRMRSTTREGSGFGSIPLLGACRQ